MSDAVIISNGTTIPVYVSGASDVAGPTGPTGPAMEIATRTALAALSSPAAGQSRYLVEDGRQGIFVFDSSNLSAKVTADPNQSVYVPPSAAPTGASGAWVRQPILPTVKYAGAKGDNVTNDGAAVIAELGYLQATATTGSTEGIGGGLVRLPKSSAAYYLGTNAIDFYSTLRFEGESVGELGGYSSWFRWAAGSTGLRVQRYNTTGDTSTDGVPAYASKGGDGSVISGLTLQGAYTTTEGEYHGVLMRARASLRDSFLTTWQGDGVRILADNTQSYKGNANSSEVYKVTAIACRHGFHSEGADANVIFHAASDYINNRGWGVYDQSLLNNVHVGIHTSGNGLFGTGTASNPASSVSIGGYRYCVKVGQETGASTNAPKSSTVTITIASPGVVTWTAHGLTDGKQVAFSTTGALPTGLSQNTAYYVVNSAANTFQVSATFGGAAINTSGSQSGTHTAGAAVDNTWWYYWTAGAATTGVPAWVSGITLRAGGSFCTAGSNAPILFSGCYAESGQPPMQLGPNTLVNGGTMFNDRIIGGAWLRASLNKVEVSDFHSMAGVVADGPLSEFGPTTGAAADSALQFENTNVVSAIVCRSWAAGTPQVDATFRSRRGFTAQVYGAQGVDIGVGNPAIAPTLVLTVDGNGTRVSTGSMGYAAGTGGAVTQITSKATATPAINKACGQVTMNNAALAAGAKVSFVVTNNTVAATDTVVVSVASGGTANAYRAAVTAVGAGTGFTITVENITAGSLSEAPVINFAIIKAVAT